MPRVSYVQLMLSVLHLLTSTSCSHMHALLIQALIYPIIALRQPYTDIRPSGFTTASGRRLQLQHLSSTHCDHLHRVMRYRQSLPLPATPSESPNLPFVDKRLFMYDLPGNGPSPCCRSAYIADIKTRIGTHCTLRQTCCQDACSGELYSCF